MINKISTLMDVFENATQSKPRLFALGVILGVVFSYYVFKRGSNLDEALINEYKTEIKDLKQENRILQKQTLEAYNKGRRESLGETKELYNFLKEIAK